MPLAPPSLIIYHGVGFVNSYTHIFLIKDRVRPMVTGDKLVCPKCGGELKHYDTVKRIVRTRGGKRGQIRVRRACCLRCGAVHRRLPDTLLPFKQYEAEVIFGVLEGVITCETLGFEDYPCEMTMARWMSQKARLMCGK